jgi:hypothetical protein
METLWVYALVAFLVALSSEGDRPTPVGAAAVVFISFSISRLLQHSDLPLNLMRFWGVLVSVLIFYVIVRIDFFGDWRLWDFSWADAVANDTREALRNQAAAVVGIPLLWLVWMRGILKGQQHIDFESVATSFALGVVIVAFVEVFANAVNAPGSVGAIAVPYVAVGLLAIGTTQAARGDEQGQPFTTTWFGIIAAFVAVLAVIGLLFALTDFTPISNAMGYVARPISYGIGLALYYTLWPIFKVLEVLMRVVSEIFQAGFGQATKDLIPGDPSPTPTPDETTTHELPGWFAWVLRIGLGVPIFVAILAATALLFTKFRKRDAEDEVKESTYEEGRLGQDLSGMLSGLFGGLRRHHADVAALDPARRLYFEVVQAGVGRDVIRGPSETPLELAPRLDNAFGGRTPSRITSLFQDVRYGGADPPVSDVEALRADWDELKE